MFFERFDVWWKWNGIKRKEDFGTSFYIQLTKQKWYKNMFDILDLFSKMSEELSCSNSAWVLSDESFSEK